MKKLLISFKSLFFVSTLFCSAFVTSCSGTVKDKDKNILQPIDEHVVTFGVDGGGGKLTAEIDGKPVDSPVKTVQGKTVIFKAEPENGKTVNKWTITNGAFLKGGKDGGFTAEIKVTGKITVKVSFKDINNKPSPQPSDEHVVTFGVDGGGGKLTAEMDGKPVDSPVKTVQGKTVIFKAEPEDGKSVDKWTITNGAFLKGGKDGGFTAEIKVTGKITVKVSFKDSAGGADADASLVSIETASVDEKGNAKQFFPVENFDINASAVFQAAEAQTAWIWVKVKTRSEARGEKDFLITLENQNTFIETSKFEKGEKSGAGFYLIRACLSQGSNTLNIKVKSMDKSAEKIYKTVITYGGGPKPSEGKIIPGVYCPAQRKPSDGEKSEPIWIIAGHGG